MTASAVLARYDELATMVAGTVRAGSADRALTADAAALLAAEARLLDAGRFEDWLALLTDDAVMWVPLRADAHPAHDQSLFLDDGRRLTERVARLRDPAAWAVAPPSLVVRVVGSVEAWPDTALAPSCTARSAIVITEHRGARTRAYAGHQVHRFLVTPDGWRIAAKVLLLPGLVDGTANLGFLL